MNKPIADEALDLDIQLALLVGEGTEQTPYDTKMLKKFIARHTATTQHQLLAEVLKQLPLVKDLESPLQQSWKLGGIDINSYTEGYRYATRQVVSIIEHYLTKEEKS